MRAFYALILGILLAAASPRAPKEFYIDTPYHGPEDIKKMVDQGFDLVGIDQDKKIATYFLGESELKRLGDLRISAKRPVLAPDLGFKKPLDIEQILAATQTKYPNLAQVEVIGKSVEGRNIYAIHLSNHSLGGKKPTVLFDAMHHAREIMTPEVALDIVSYLTENYATDAKVKKWMDTYSIWVVPMVNPDGNHKVWTAQSMWRKNNQGGYGVDINRNYPYAWNSCGGSSGSKGSETYHGPKAGSEPETNALMDLAKKIRPVFNISYHSTSEIVIYPYGCNPKHIPAPDRAIYEGVGKELASKLVRDSGAGSYQAGTSYELLYNVDGGSIDWMYEQDKIMAFVIEINSSSQGFQPSYKKWRDITVQRQRAGWMYILDRMEGPGIKP